MSTIGVNESTIYYERSGEGPGILWIHGMCGDADVWADQARRLADRYACVAYDRRGHRRSVWGDAPISAALHADDAAALIEALDLAPCLVVGSSGGAAIAVDVALRHGHLLRGVVLSEPPLFGIDHDAGQVLMSQLVPVVEAAIAEGGPRAGVDAFFSLLCPGLWSILGEDRKDDYRNNAEIGFADLKSPSVEVTTDDLAAIAVPALVLAGTTSHPSLLSVAHELVASLPDVRFVELEGSGHVTYAEKPDQFAEAVSSFAAEIDHRMEPIATDDRGIGRFDVTSADGTSIAVFVEGTGPALVLVHGSIADHTTFDPFLFVLREDFTTFSMDRRGFGASEDGDRYAIERDFEDVAAVVDEVAARTGGPVALFGHSYGANCAMGGAARTGAVDHLVLYEPSFGIAYPPGSIDGIQASLARGDREAAILEVLAEILQMSQDEIDQLRAGPLWPVRLAAAHTIPRECRVEDGWVFEPGQFDGVAPPALLLSGSDSVAAIVEATGAAAAAIPRARVEVLEGHAHFAHKTDPALVSGLIQKFLASC